jgi:hypothetical protein
MPTGKPSKSNKNALRELMRARPEFPELEKTMDSLRAAGDIEAAILGASMLEVELERLLKSKLKSTDATLPDVLFGDRGPLSDFSSKTLVARAFGFISEPMAGELKSISVIRNTFAHAPTRLTFEHEAVAKAVASLRMIAAVKATAVAKGASFDFAPTTKESYLLEVRVLLIMFDGIRDHGGLANDALTDFLYPDREP